MPDESPAPTAPRVFISYSWSRPAHEAWVLELAARLRGDSVDAILDKWDLTHGQDANAFMEQMVTDPTVTKVLMICDRAYVEKADNRKGGVGTEAMIISPQLYRDNSTDQTKFAAACLERDDQGDPCVPVFYKGRLHFDFTRPDRHETEYDALLRWSYSKPRHVRPPLGQMPSSLVESPAAGAVQSSAEATSFSPQTLERAETFRRERLAEILAGRTPSVLAAGALAVLHMAPLPSFQASKAADIVAMIAKGAHMPVPLAGRGGQTSFSLQGVNNTLGEGGYGLLFRNGAFEGTHALSVHDGAPYLASIAFANMVVGAVRRALALQSHYGFGFPTAVMLSFCNAAGVHMRLRTEFRAGYYETQALGQDVVTIPPVTFSGPDLDVPAVLRPLLNATWNAFGQAGCDLYDGQGLWTGVA